MLQQDETPALYVVEQAFANGGGKLRRFGLLARFRAEDAEKRLILPHEHTRAAAKEDRWRVLNATRANFSPIFLMFPDPERRFGTLVQEAMAPPATAVYTDDGGVAHRLWRVSDAGAIGRFQELIGGAKAYIADGHHRHATALRYRDANGPEGAWTLGYFTPMGVPGLLVQPYHRILAEGPSLDVAEQKLAGRFRTARAPDAVAGGGGSRSVAGALRLRARRAGRGRARGRGAAGQRDAARRRGAAQPARARHLLPAPRRARSAARGSGCGGQLRPLDEGGRAGARGAEPAVSRF